MTNGSRPHDDFGDYVYGGLQKFMVHLHTGFVGCRYGDSVRVALNLLQNIYVW